MSKPRDVQQIPQRGSPQAPVLQGQQPGTISRAPAGVSCIAAALHQLADQRCHLSSSATAQGGGLWQPVVPHLEQSMQLPHAQLWPSLFSGPMLVSTHKWLEIWRHFGLESVQAGIELILFSQYGAVFQTCAGNSSDYTEVILGLLSRACNNKKSRLFLPLVPPWHIQDS